MATAKSNLKEIPWERVGVRLNTPARSIKMLNPVCPETVDQNTGNAAPGCETKEGPAWWLKCVEKGHDPFHQQKEVRKRERITETTEDGRTIVKGYEETIELEITPRVAQVPLSIRTQSQQMVEEKRFFHGYKYPEELGYAPMCEFRNCFAPNPTFKTRYGNYCSENEARMMAADSRHVVLEVLNQDKRREQLEGINIV